MTATRSKPRTPSTRLLAHEWRKAVAATLPIAGQPADNHVMDASTRRVVAGPGVEAAQASKQSCEHCGEPEAEIGVYAHDVWLWLHRDCARNGAVAEINMRRLARKRPTARKPA